MFHVGMTPDTPYWPETESDAKMCSPKDNAPSADPDTAT
ncbi:hypothetical protein RB2654_13925 [Rhodobacterales bacterium HTCC2654]|uniref:Uncharacterized protein n=1 Tax=Maritimibacter alkaliphilus HTCC2654 TaxID=314271 RepID=A3VGI4_9RHOB|nr:hypothetical protein RB2654_13925 [Rhodobacterales bacterium HTCC2654] [Maritimibacter alkaliphilus HTCC2654]